jgi:hypothetical protein
MPRLQRYNFADAVARNIMNIPSNSRLALLRKGDLVKVNHNAERFWVLITSTNHKKKKITGTVNNYLIFSQPFKCGDKITFGYQNIYQLMYQI